MSIWILTIGSSDVQLKTKTNWPSLFRAVQSQFDRGFRPVDGDKGRFQVPARVMGVVYSQAQAERHFGDLAFPLIDNFIEQIQDRSIDKILLILSDQSVFSRAERSSQQHPYWQDTCTLEPILVRYLTAQLKDSSPHLEIQSLFLKPSSSAEGLDSWDFVLKLVQREFSASGVEFPEAVTVYVSHQASTPAISSAIQFTSLSRFGQQVKFLVSNERDSQLTRILDGSAYLKGIRKQEAKALLNRYDYLGVEALVRPYLENDDTITLLNAAIQWNFAEFENFRDRLTGYDKFTHNNQYRELSKDYWWTAYESAYLGYVRLQQGNTVEAMFHSFRAVEGLLSIWLKEHEKSLENLGQPRLSRDKRGMIQLPREVTVLNKEGNEVKRTSAHAYGQGLYCLIDAIRTIDKDKNVDIWVFGNFVFHRRNELFHQLEGLQDKEDVFKEWQTSDEQKTQIFDEKRWKDRVKNCLDFVSGKKFESLEAASLMVKVHQALEEAIAQL